MDGAFRPLPRLAFGEERAVLQHDLNAYRDQLSRVVSGLSELEPIQAGPFRQKSLCAEINGLRLFANAQTPLRARTNTSSDALAVFVLSGDGQFGSGGRPLQFKPGDVVYAPEGIRHATSSTCSLLNMPLSRPRMFEAFQAIAGDLPDARHAARLSEGHVGPVSTGASVMEHMGAIIRAIDTSLDNMRPLEVLALDQVLYRLVAASVWPELLVSTVSMNGIPDSRERAILSMLRDYIHANLGRPLQLTSLAILAGTSTRRVRAIFLKALGLTPADYIRNARLAQARHLIETAPEKRIREISAELGFTRASSFAVEYRQRFGEPPLATRSRAEGRGIA